MKAIALVSNTILKKCWNKLIIKSFQFSLIAAAFAEPYAEAKPEAYYSLGNAGYGHAYAGDYYGKRDAEPKADAYNTYGLGYAGYPYAHHRDYHGKREAEPMSDSEPEADADDYLSYGLRAYGYAGYPYAHTGYYYG